MIPALDRAQNFPEAVLLGVGMECLLSDKDVLSAELEYCLQRAIAFDPTVGLRLKFYRGFQRLFPWVAMEWLLGDEDVWSVELEYRLKRAIAFDPIVGSRSKFSRGCFPWGSNGMATR